MKGRVVGRALALGVLIGMCACSLLVDTSELDAGCGPGMKECDGKCVGTDEPFYGCKPGCSPCPGEHIVHRCENNECTFEACAYGWGCAGCTESLLTDADNCGKCDNKCSDEPDWTCSDGVCVSPDGVRDPTGTGGEGGGGLN